MKTIWKILDKFACWLSNQCWKQLYKNRTVTTCKCKRRGK
jgi:hypothetical protein